MVCAACLRAELEPVREKLAHARGRLPSLKARCREAFKASEAANASRRDLELATAETQRAESVLREVARFVCEERVRVAVERRRVLERTAALDAGNAELGKRCADFEAVRRAVFGDGGTRRRKLLECSPWRRAVDVFSLFPIKRVSASPSRRKSLRGIMTILGLPLPNVAIFPASLPRTVCRAALAAVAQLVASVAAALRVDLPHPLVPRLGTAEAAAVDEKPQASRRRYPLAPPEVQAPVRDHDTFATALQLLQNDVTHVCVKAGVPPADLWPAEAILLNLVELRDKARAELANSRTPYSRRPSFEDHQSGTDDDAHHDAASTHYSSSPRHVDDDTDDDVDDWIFLGKLPFLGFAPGLDIQQAPPPSPSSSKKPLPSSR
ncbi:hypothetical protein CTAYLR_003440 [Chrysophaeum taylorii]|uniref:Uncharacterized protein n=1 Tax=Chrysophaeum taylorii TaxID=2483200 RepID=A0AAD7U7Y3_9STRA|nr:hypothetical protein CTAYLR_003440 [Chrysophaeum taylorii]